MKNNWIAIIMLSSASSAYAQLDLSVKFDSFLKKANSVQKIELAPEKNFTAIEIPIPTPDNKPELVQKKILLSPKLIKLPSINVVNAGKPKVIWNPVLQAEAPEVKPLAKVEEPLILNDQINLSESKALPADEYKLIQGLIFLQVQKKYDLALSLFAELSEASAYKNEATFRYAESSYALDLFSEFRQKMLQVSEESNNSSLKKMAAESLMDHIESLPSADIALIDPLVDEMNLEFRKSDAYLLKEAKYHLAQNNLGAAEHALSKIEDASDSFTEASLLTSNLNYRRGDLNTAIKNLERVGTGLESKKSQMRNMIFLTLARLKFQKADYKAAYANYLKIEKSSPLWLQAMVEQAWTQILAGDYIGAAGNMFSLHTDFFKKAYAPETYTVRTVGYLNLCQYGDAIAVLNNLNGRFTKIQQSLKGFQSETKPDMAYYELIRSWLKDTDQMLVQNIPRSFIVELARHPSFTTRQSQINAYEDEIKKFNGLNASFNNRILVVKQRLAKIKETPQINVEALEIESKVAKNSDSTLKKARQQTEVRLEIEKTQLKKNAAVALKKRFDEFTEVLTHILEQNEVLAYEIYSGAGEHIRYQMAGGGVSDRKPTALTPEEKNSYKWKFKGEVWEDEIGHYRSSLTNVCPTDEVAQHTGGQ
jgi:hypothetical protein